MIPPGSLGSYQSYLPAKDGLQAGRGIDQAGERSFCLGGLLIWKLNIQIRCEVDWGHKELDTTEQAHRQLVKKVGAGNTNLGDVSIEGKTRANEVG